MNPTESSPERKPRETNKMNRQINQYKVKQGRDGSGNKK